MAEVAVVLVVGVMAVEAARAVEAVAEGIQAEVEADRVVEQQVVAALQAAEAEVVDTINLNSNRNQGPKLAVRSL
jgi:hypothetical protein